MEDELKDYLYKNLYFYILNVGDKSVIHLIITISIMINKDFPKKYE